MAGVTTREEAPVYEQRIEFLTQAEADQMAGQDADYHQRDLYTAIGRGQYPS